MERAGNISRKIYDSLTFLPITIQKKAKEMLREEENQGEFSVGKRLQRE